MCGDVDSAAGQLSVTFHSARIAQSGRVANDRLTIYVMCTTRIYERPFLPTAQCGLVPKMKIGSRRRRAGDRVRAGASGLVVPERKCYAAGQFDIL